MIVRDYQNKLCTHGHGDLYVTSRELLDEIPANA